jgi:hypothetical protein
LAKAIFPKIILISFLGAALTANSSAQTNWIGEKKIPSARFEFYKAQYETDFPFNFADFVLVFSYENSIGYLHSLKLEFPFSKAVGSPYIGIKVWKNDSTAIGEMGLRIPLIADTDNKGIGGIFTNYDRFDAFSDTYISFYPRIYLPYIFQKFGFRANLGLAFLIPIRHRQAGYINTELFARYGLDILYGFSNVKICSGLTGITHLTAEDFETDNTEILFGAGSNLNIKNVNVGFRINYPLGEGLDNVVDVVYNLYVQTAIKN